MSYVIDRKQAFRDEAIVAILSARTRGVRSRILLRDGSSHQTLTRPRTLRRVVERAHAQIQAR